VAITDNLTTSGITQASDAVALERPLGASSPPLDVLTGGI